MFIIFISGLLITGTGIGLSITEVVNTKYIDNEPKTSLKRIKSTYEYDINDNILLGTYGNHLVEDYTFNRLNINYIIDNTITDKILVETSYYEEFSTIHINEYTQNNYKFIDFNNRINANNKIIKIVLNNLKNKEIYNYNNLYSTNITIKSSEENINKLKENSKNYYKKLDEINENEELNNCYDKLENMDELYSSIDTYKNEINELKNKNEELESKINEYKSKLKDILDE